MTSMIRVDKLGKCYRVPHGPQARYRTLRESLMELATRPFRRIGSRAASEQFWALRDVSFEVTPGVATGIIGRNGAGKSTLLKILSRITKPTTGQATLRGRVGSLLEVGAGFHGELTGRENVYLNGSILGMSRAEIRRRFDAIVAFSEVEQFLDLPVKRYSSGMYVRLAFAVAAHLDPEVLIVDEVLAVGDAAFQHKCLRKLGEISRSGRTILYVSHNLATVRSLCQEAIVLERGQLISQGAAEAQIAFYLARLATLTSMPLAERADRTGTGQARATLLRFEDECGNPVEHALSGRQLCIRIGYQTDTAMRKLDRVCVSFGSGDGHTIFHVDNLMRGVQLSRCGPGEQCCIIPRLPLAAGTYQLTVTLGAEGEIADCIGCAAALEVLPGDFYGIGQLTEANGGLVFIDHDWT